MTPIRIRAFAVASMLVLATAPTATVAAPPPTAAGSQATLTAAFAQLATQTDGAVGVAVQRVGGTELTTLNPGVTFPMASTFKIAVAGAVLARVDKGELRLDQMVTVDPSVIVQSAGIAEQMPHPGIAMSVHNLLELMLTRSDNTATDVMTAQAGGPAAVTAWLRKVGVTAQRVDSDTARVIYRAYDVTPSPGTFQQNMAAAMAANPEKSKLGGVPNPAFNADPRDATTPEAMVQLLLTIRSGKALSAASTATLIGVMERCHTGDARLKGLLPLGTVVAHKTGTLRSIANDVGIVTLPDGGQFAIAVYVKGDTKGTVVQDRVIAEIARSAYDYFMLGGS